MKTSTILFYLAIMSAFILAISGCKDGDRRRDRDYDRPPATEQPAPDEPSAPPEAPAIDFRSTTGSGVREDPNDTFTIPACGRGKLGYIVTRWTTPLRATATMRVEFTVTASPDAKIIGYEDNKSPGRAAMYFQRDSHDREDPQALDARFYERGYRQWSHAREFLTPGDHVFEVPLVPEAWNFGKTGFSSALLDPANVGITLSGAESAGHGVCMAAGTASVTIKAISVD